MIPEEHDHDQETGTAGIREDEVLVEMAEEQQALKPFASVPLKLSIELGRSTLKLSNLLKLGYHSVIELDKPVGNSLDIFINGVFLGRGEVVIIEDKVGIKINELADHNG
jgi:flagellar motor switch protein FliN/FliY